MGLPKARLREVCQNSLDGVGNQLNSRACIFLGRDIRRVHLTFRSYTNAAINRVYRAAVVRASGAVPMTENDSL